MLTAKTINTGAEVVSTKLYVQAFKELIDEVIRENRNDLQRAKELIINEVLRKTKKAFKLQHCQEIKMHAAKRLTELGTPVKELEEIIEE